MGGGWRGRGARRIWGRRGACRVDRVGWSGGGVRVVDGREYVSLVISRYVIGIFVVASSLGEKLEP